MFLSQSAYPFLAFVGAHGATDIALHPFKHVFVSYSFGLLTSFCCRNYYNDIVLVCGLLHFRNDFNNKKIVETFVLVCAFLQSFDAMFIYLAALHAPLHAVRTSKIIVRKSFFQKLSTLLCGLVGAIASVRATNTFLIVSLIVAHAILN